jgi:signal transduction histidine kinase
LYSYAVSPTNIVNRISPAELFILCSRANENNGTYVQIYQQYIKETRRGPRPWDGYDGEAPEYFVPGSAEPKRSEQMPEYGGEGDGNHFHRFTRGEPPIFVSTDVLLNLISTRVANLPSGKNCFIIVDSVITPVGATVRTLVVMLMYISIFTIFAALIIAFLLARRIANPIIRMNKSAKRLAKGDYSTRFDSSGYLEIEQLNETMNYAAVELSRADELRRELIANVSHDLRTPLTMIIGYSEVMRDIPGENSPENVQVIIDEATRLSLLVNDLLDISRLQAGTEKIKCEEYNLTRSIRDIISRFDKLKENDGYNITFETDGDITVNADEARIAQAVYNLIGNAINYTGEDKSVRVVQKIYDGKVRIEITDSGEGIAKEELPYIWDRYYKVDKTHKRAEAGTGLGLSIVKTVFESHGAVYGVDSTVGEGSTFWFELDAE